MMLLFWIFLMITMEVLYKEYSGLTKYVPHPRLFRRYRRTIVDEISELMWINVHFWEYLSMSYDERCSGKLRKCCWCRIWLYWLYCALYMEVVLLMKILRFLNLKWINFWPTCPIPRLCLSSPLVKTSEDNYRWKFWINVKKYKFWQNYGTIHLKSWL